MVLRDIRVLRAVLGSVAALSATDSLACDELVSRLLASAIRPEIEALDCGELAKVGLDVAEHRLQNLCYESTGPESKITLVAALSCKTSDSAFISASISEEVTAIADVRAGDCQITQFEVSGSDIADVLIEAFNVNSRAREALQNALAQAC